MRIWRLTHERFRDAAFTGEGTLSAGSRWMPAGHRAVYASRSLSLCVLELLVHLEVRHIQEHFVAFAIDVPGSLDIERVDIAELPQDWRAVHGWERLQAVGAAWLKGGRSVLLQVPSAVVPEESNFLLNPAHPDYRRLAIGPAASYHFDHRLVQ